MRNRQVPGRIVSDQIQVDTARRKNGATPETGCALFFQMHKDQANGNRLQPGKAARRSNALVEDGRDGGARMGAVEKEREGTTGREFMNPSGGLKFSIKTAFWTRSGEKASSMRPRSGLEKGPEKKVRSDRK